MNPFFELIESSHKEKRSLTLFIKGQTVAGIVVKIIEGGTIELKSQTYSRVIVRLDAIDAVAAT